MTLKFYIGLISFSLSLIAIFLNFLIFMPVFRLAFVSRKSTIYIIAFFNIISDLMQLFITGFHLSLSIMADRYILSGSQLSEMSIFLAGVFIDAWFLENVVQIVMAVNRFAVITLNKKDLFTFKNTILIFVILNCITLFSSVCSQYWYPCCKLIGDHELMTYTLVSIEGVYSYTNFTILSYDIFCTSLSTFCYMSVLNTIRSSTKTAPESVKSARTHQDIKYLIHFVFISIFYVCTWVSFETLPFIVPAHQPEWYGVIPFCIIFNCSTNAVIYLSANIEVQKSLQIPWIRRKLYGGPRSSAVIPAVPSTTPATIPTN